MRRNAISSAVQEEEAEINMTPMLDVVFHYAYFLYCDSKFYQRARIRDQ